MQIMKITSFFSKAHNWKSPGNDQTQNYWLKDITGAHRYITKSCNATMEEIEKISDLLTIGLTYFL
jgi:hypothetical protein